MEYKIKQMIGDEHNFRYILASECLHPLVVIGVNPSTANETIADRTMSKVMGFAERNGYDGFIMLNLYPQRSTNFDGVHKEKNEELHKNNLNVIREYFESFNEIDVLVAFGNLVRKRSYLLDCFRDISSVISENNRKISWKQIGDLTQAKNPRHPLYANYNLELKEFDITSYIKK